MVLHELNELILLVWPASSSPRWHSLFFGGGGPAPSIAALPSSWHPVVWPASFHRRAAIILAPSRLASVFPSLRWPVDCHFISFGTSIRMTATLSACGLVSALLLRTASCLRRFRPMAIPSYPLACNVLAPFWSRTALLAFKK